MNQETRCRGHARISGLMVTALLAVASPLLNADSETLTRAQVVEKLREASPDLSSTTLDGVDLSELDFRGANLFAAKLRKAKLTGSNLRGCNLNLAILRDADLSGATLEGTVLSDAMVEQAVFRSVSGLETVIGLETARGKSLAVFE